MRREWMTFAYSPVHRDQAQEDLALDQAGYNSWRSYHETKAEAAAAARKLQAALRKVEPDIEWRGCCYQPDTGEAFVVIK